MSTELRQNLVNKEWVVIAAERGKKPNKVLGQVNASAKPTHSYDKNCPFCPGNELNFQIEQHDQIDSGLGEWQVRSIENKFGIFNNSNICPEQLSPFDQEGIYQKYSGCGNHELVIESRNHHLGIGQMNVAEIKLILELYVKRYGVLRKNPNNLIAFIFKNYGALAGQSQPHSHSQIVGSRVVPQYIRSLLNEAQRHFDVFGSCVVCDMIKFEKQHQQRIVAENEEFVFFVPFAASAEHAAWICPKEHAADISSLSSQSTENLAQILKLAFERYQLFIGDIDFNYVFRLAPYSFEKVPFCHWYLEILPRTKILGGFERATRLPVNTVLPEYSAQLLRGDFKCSGLN